MKRMWLKFRFVQVPLAVLFLVPPPTTGAEASSADALPPPAPGQIEFARDIRPILEATCLRCHGSQRPKSHFSLASRETALAGGDENTNDIVPGDSTRSLLIRYVARQVPDLEMPPPGRGEPLTPAEISRLRAWIDQGAGWNATTSSPALHLTVAPTLRWFDVHGNPGKFRELEGSPAGFAGGAESFSAEEQLRPDENISLEGHVILPAESFATRLSWTKTGRGFIHAGLDQWRQYYNDAGGYDPAVTPPGFFFDRDLHVDHGRAWVDFGLDLPRWPLIVLGYEYQYQQGTESTLDWGYANGKNIYPATQSVDEHTHLLKLDLSQAVNDWQLADQARVVFFSADNTGQEAAILLGGATPDQFVSTRDNHRQVQGMNTFSVEKQIRDWWRLTGGFYYSRLSGSDYFNQTTAIPAFGFANTLSSQKITLNRESEIFSVASLFTPLEYAALSLGTQNEWTRESGFSAGIPDLELGGTVPADSSLDEFKASQSATARFTKIPATVVFGDARFSEDNYRLAQAESPEEFQNETVANNFHYALTPGLVVSPCRGVEWTGQYTWQSSRTDYQPATDVWQGVPGPTNGYPGFMLGRTIRKNQFESKLTLRPAAWLKTTLCYQRTSARYYSTTAPAYDFNLLAPVSSGGAITAGKDDRQTFGAGVTLTPAGRWYFSGDFTYSHSRLVTAAGGNSPVAPYVGNLFTLATVANYALDLKTGLQLAGNYSHAGYGENNAVAGIAAGLDYARVNLIAGLTRKLTERLSGALHYEFSQYTEPSAGGLNNFTANGVFLTLNYRWP